MSSETENKFDFRINEESSCLWKCIENNSTFWQCIYTCQCKVKLYNKMNCDLFLYNSEAMLNKNFYAKYSFDINIMHPHFKHLNLCLHKYWKENFFLGIADFPIFKENSLSLSCHLIIKWKLNNKMQNGLCLTLVNFYENENQLFRLDFYSKPLYSMLCMMLT